MLTNLSNTDGQPNATVAVQPGMQVQPVVIVDSGGNAVTPLVNPMTTLGDMIDGGASGAPARLAGPTAASKKFLTSAGNGTVAAAPAWGTIATSDLPVISGQYLAMSQYAPAGIGTLTASGTALAAFSSANVNTGSFTAPPSGTVVVTASFYAVTSNSAAELAVALATHGTTTPAGFAGVMQFSSTGYCAAVSIPFVVGSLAAGTSYNFDLMGAATTADSWSILAVGTQAPVLTSGVRTGGPVVMTVQAV